jgi:hypothetical protein
MSPVDTQQRQPCLIPSATSIVAAQTVIQRFMGRITRRAMRSYAEEGERNEIAEDQSVCEINIFSPVAFDGWFISGQTCRRKIQRR